MNKKQAKNYKEIMKRINKLLPPRIEQRYAHGIEYLLPTPLTNSEFIEAFEKWLEMVKEQINSPFRFYTSEGIERPKTIFSPAFVVVDDIDDVSDNLTTMETERRERVLRDVVAFINWGKDESVGTCCISPMQPLSMDSIINQIAEIGKEKFDNEYQSSFLSSDNGINSCHGRILAMRRSLNLEIEPYEKVKPTKEVCKNCDGLRWCQSENSFNLYPCPECIDV